jgi:hypothetical protein
MYNISFNINGAERTRQAKIFAGAASDAQFSVDYRDFQ